ncbi:MAG: glycosyltransferase family 2 protein [Acutalibacteraceae bacterium]|nr:glycosyltransferase family 2 protein [Acutalibacteraceae bacterium]
MSVKISVIIPVYKVEKYLRKCLDSVLTQDFDSFEVIAVNDGSPDSCGEILKEYFKLYNNLLIISQENKGLGGARNTGIENAKGKYILFVDSDDCLENGCLSYLYDIAETNNAHMVCFGADYVDVNGKTVNTYKASDNGCHTVTKEEYMVKAIDNPYAWNKLYLASLFKETGIRFPTREWFEDLATLPKTVLHCERIVLSDKIFYKYLQRSDSIIHTVNNNRNIEMLSCTDSLISYFKEQSAFEKFYSELEYAAILHILVLCVNKIAASDPTHPLLKHFYEYVKKNFNSFNKNPYIKTNLSLKRKILLYLSTHKMYKAINFINRLA